MTGTKKMELNKNLMAKKIKYGTQHEIRTYCLKKIKSIAKDFLTDNKVYENELLDIIYSFCKDSFLETGEYNITEDEISYIVLQEQRKFNVTNQIINNKAVFFGVSKDDHGLLFEITDKNKKEYKKYYF